LVNTLITSTTVLPARRDQISFDTADGLTLVGEVSWPESRSPVSTALFFNPLPTAGGFMDSHVIRKAAWRLPALADIAVFRFNFRGVTSPRGTSEGHFGEGVEEKYDLEAALRESERLGLPAPWLIGWSFGTEVILKHARPHAHRIAGVILLSPPLHRTSPEEVAAWQDSAIPVVALIPELDDFLPPERARKGFASAPHIELVVAEGAQHLWVGEKQTRFVLNEITKRLNPVALPLPEAWTA
jgi:alpha/beta superfamily hydrolase